MKSTIQKYLKEAIQSISDNPHLAGTLTTIVEYSRTPKHGDFSSNIALSMGKSLNKEPMQLAQQLVDYLNTLPNTPFDKIEALKPGFINFFVQPALWLSTLPTILKKQAQYGATDFGQQRHVLLEFVSSNPTGPLHIGHGRAAAQGDILAGLLRTVGYQVHTEYYINDAGRQMDILSCSIWLRYLESLGTPLPKFPGNAYQGSYIKAIAEELKNEYGARFLRINDQFIASLSTSEVIEEEKFIDGIIRHIKELFGQKQYQQLLQFGLDYILRDIQDDLSEFNVHFDVWFSEKSLIESRSVEHTIQQLKEKGHTYVLEGNLWFRSTRFGDDKDRVLLRANGQPTYFAVDAAYRLNILQTRKFNTIINLLGADHHGYLARIHAVISALGYPKEHIIFSTLQMVSLYRGQERLPLSTRSGEFITLRDLRKEVGNEAARVFFILKKSNQAIDFDLELAKSQSHQNPVYYLQYAYARIMSLMRQLEAKHLSFTLEEGLLSLKALALPQEIALTKQLTQYPHAILQAATQHEPYLLLQYLRELVKGFHAYYNGVPILTQDRTLRSARLTLTHAIKQVLQNGCTLLGICTPNTM